MTSTKSKAAAVGAVAAALAVMLAYSALIVPATADAPTSTSTNTASSTSNSASTTVNAPPGHGGQFGGRGWGQFQGGPFRGGLFGRPAANLTVGQTITVASTNGKYVVASNHTQSGTASGTLTFTVTGKLSAGYTLSITSGSLVVNGATYTVSSGSAQMDRSASGLMGQGATSSSGAFLVSASAHGSFAGNTATVSMDLSSGSSEYLVFLAGSITG